MAVPQSDWKRPAGHSHTSWRATMKNDLSYHNLSVKDATELALDRPLWRLLAASGATQWNGASWTMTLMVMQLFPSLNWHHQRQLSQTSDKAVSYIEDLSQMIDKKLSYHLSNGPSGTSNDSNSFVDGDSCLATSGSNSTLPVSSIWR